LQMRGRLRPYADPRGRAFDCGRENLRSHRVIHLRALRDGCWAMCCAGFLSCAAGILRVRRAAASTGLPALRKVSEPALCPATIASEMKTTGADSTAAPWGRRSADGPSHVL